jgi:protein-S-isoprenylcysteine O-methyltransferase Ste14
VGLRRCAVRRAAKRMTGAEMSGRMRPQMRRARIIALLLSPTIALLATAPLALAKNGGEGWYGETNDVVITNWMFLTIIFFIVVVSLFSLIQWRLEKRKHARMDAKKRAAASADPRGGW